MIECWMKNDKFRIFSPSPRCALYVKLAWLRVKLALQYDKLAHRICQIGTSGRRCESDWREYLMLDDVIYIKTIIRLV